MPRKFASRMFLILFLAGAAAAQSYAVDPGKEKPSASAIQIEMTGAGESRIPVTFRYAIYEQMVGHVERSGTFKTTYRSGDRRAKEAPDLLTLRTIVGKFREGSQTVRELTDFFGWTRVEVNAVVAAPDGRTLLEKTVIGKIRFRGDNLKVTDDLGKQLTKLLRENFNATGIPAASATK
jgi:hypothetical protein